MTEVVDPSNGGELFVPNDPACDSDGSLPDLECHLCRKEFNNVKAYEQHLLGKKHHQMMSNERAKEKMAAQVNGKVDGDDDGDEELSATHLLSCKICSKSFSGYIPFVTHMRGSTHLKNLEKERLKNEMKDLPEVIKDDGGDDDDVLRKPYAQCTPCKKTFYDPKAYALHLKGNQHEKKMKGQKACESLQIDEDDEGCFKCDVCRKEFSGPVPYKAHLHSACHQKELERSKMEDELKDSFTKDPDTRRLACKECGKLFNDVMILKAHLSGNGHQKQKAKEEVFGFVTSHPEIVAVKTIHNDEDDDDFRIGSYFLVCKLCRASFSGPQSAKEHLSSKKHVQAKSERELRRRMAEKENAGDSGAEKKQSVLVLEKDKDVQKSRKDSETNDGFELV